MPKNKKVLITGCAGFIGSHLSEACLREGHQVYGLDNLSRKGTELNLHYLESLQSSSFHFQKLDLLKEDELYQFFIDKGPFEWIAHEAGQVAVTTSLEDPLSDFKSNAQGTLPLLEAIRNHSPKSRLIYASTNKVYGELRNLEVVEEENRYSFSGSSRGVGEDMPLDFHSPYGCSKGTADQYVCDYARSFGIEATAFRQSCIYGTRQFGLEDQGWVAWFLIATALRKNITVFGNGKQVRDLLWIEDLCSIYLKCWQCEEFPKGQAFNVGGGKENTLSLLELFGLLEKMNIPEVERTFGSWRKGDQKIFYSDNSKAKDMLAWKPAISPEEGIRKLWNWINNNLSSIEKALKENPH